jgi:radical SAM protein with 4Fe4S-binding SPASM domain
MAVDPAGRVLPCQSFFLPAGRLLDDDWDGIWNGPVMRAVRQWRSRRPECEGCPDLDLCRGGCPLEENFDIELGRALGPVIASPPRSEWSATCTGRPGIAIKEIASGLSGTFPRNDSNTDHRHPCHCEATTQSLPKQSPSLQTRSNLRHGRAT